MALSLKLFLAAQAAILVCGVVLLGYGVLTDRIPPMPRVPDVPVKWFGKGDRSDHKEDHAVKPFKIHVDDKDLADLRHRLTLDLSRLREPLIDSAFTYGFNGDYLREIGTYWNNTYDWRKQERRLNSFKHFKTSIDGIDVHFIHAKPDAAAAKGKTVLPLLLVHGWPGSVVEFLQIIPLLTTPRKDVDFVFEVIAPSIPGYGWSSAPARQGFNIPQCARIFRTLMVERLSINTFYMQGGDWGAAITTVLATKWPQSVRGLHVNCVFLQSPVVTLKQVLGSLLPTGWLFDAEDEAKFLPLGKTISYLFSEMGYMHLQATRPDTVGVALSSSPLGLASYLLEKFSAWTNRANKFAKDGQLTAKYNLDDLLTNVMAYWTTGAITSSMRFYAENMAFDEDSAAFGRNPVVDTVPCGVSDFPQEIMSFPRSLVEHKFKNLVRMTRMPRGGHFAAFEEPQLLADDFSEFVKIVEQERKTQHKKKSEL